MRSVLLFVLTLFATSLCMGADVYPSRTVRFIAPGVPGNTSDVIGRMISKQLTQQTGKSFVVENRPGASGIIGTEAVARSAGDGYTLLLADSTFTTVPNLRKKLPYDPVKDFTPITQVTAAPLLMVVRPTLNAGTVKELVALAQASPGKLNFGSGGIGTPIHIYFEIFNRAAKVNITHVPFSGGAGNSVTALLGGHIDTMVSPITTLLPHVKSGGFRAVAITTADGKRFPTLPDVPSMGEAGVPGIPFYVLFGLIGPAGIPKDVAGKLHAEVVKAISVPAVRSQLVGMGAEVAGTSPEEFARHLRSEIRRFGNVIKLAGIAPTD